MHVTNAFYVLDLADRPDASPGEIERQGRKILGLFEVRAAKARTYTCPFGSFPRDETMVREAMAMLRDPKKRAKESFLARCFTGLDAPDEASAAPPDAPFDDAFLAAGYRGF